MIGHCPNSAIDNMHPRGIEAGNNDKNQIIVQITDMHDVYFKLTKQEAEILISELEKRISKNT